MNFWLLCQKKREVLDYITNKVWIYTNMYVKWFFVAAQNAGSCACSVNVYLFVNVCVHACCFQFE